jgi:two pore calcium channel protein 1
MSAPNISSDLESVVVETSSPRGSHGDLPLPSVPECPEEKEDDEPNDKGIEVIINCPSSAPTDEEDNSVSTDHEEAVRQRANTFIKIDYNEVDGITRFKNAALYLHEGENNDKFFHHPQTWWSYLAFHVVHNEVYQYTQMAISLLLMGLAIIEPPTYIDGIPPWVHSGLEMVFLLFFATDTILQLVWLQPRAFITHKRTVLKIFIILIEYIEAFVVAVRGDVHIRVLRCLRPFFFVDSFVTSGVRRVLRQMLSSLGPIIDILLLYILAVALFSLIAFLLFGSYDNIFFINFRETFVNMFIAQTSANFPDVMMQVYLEVPYAPIFFILYIVVQFYIISNMLLGLVYSSFQGQHLKKFRKLYFHKKESVKRVFHELQRKNVLHFADFYLLMKAYLPNASKIRVLCMFKALDTTHSNTITLSEFYKFYDILDLTWDRIDTEEGKSIVWHGRLPKPVHSILQVMRKIIEWPFFDLIVNVIIVANGLFLWIYTSSIELTEDNPKALDAVQKNTLIFYVSLAFTIVYAVELVIKIVVLGPAQFFLKAWNA